MKAHHFFLLATPSPAWVYWPWICCPGTGRPRRDIATVQQSANADQNTAMGPSVTQHIYGIDAVWRQYQYIYIR